MRDNILYNAVFVYLRKFELADMMINVPRIGHIYLTSWVFSEKLTLCVKEAVSAMVNI